MKRTSVLPRTRIGVALAVLIGAIAALAGFSGTPATAATPEGVIVVPLPPTTIEELNATHGTVVIDTLPELGAYLVVATDGREVELLAEQLTLDTRVEYADVNVETRAPEVSFSGRLYRWTSSPPTAAGTQWITTKLQLPTVHALSTGTGQTVAVIDSGVMPSTFFGSSLVPGWDFVDNDATPLDSTNGVDDNANGLIDEAAGHGTHVAGIIHQIAPAATIMPIRVLDDDGSSTTFMVARAMVWAVDHGATTLNLSLGQFGSSSLLKDAADHVWGLGGIVVGAAGNEGNSSGSAFPASSKCAISVVATSPTDRLSSFSSYSSKSDVGAPGEDIVSVMPYTPSGMAAWSGTSMSTPIVAAEVALIKARKPSLKNGDVARLVTRRVVTIQNKPGGLKAGRVDLVAAITAASTTNPSTGDCLQ